MFKVVDMTPAVLAHLGTAVPPRTTGNNDPADRVILATAVKLGAALVTKDELLADDRDGSLNIIW